MDCDTSGLKGSLSRKTSLLIELISEQSGERDNNGESWGMNGPGVRCFEGGLGEGLAEAIGVEVGTDREGVLVITDSLPWLVTKTRLFSLLDRSLRNTELRFS